MPPRSLDAQQLRALLGDLLTAGVEVVAPVSVGRDRLDYRSLASAAEAVFDGPPPRRSLKSFFLPPSEPLLAWRRTRRQVELDAVPTRFAPRLVLAARPCDAAGVDVLDRVMGWDYRDELWFGRRDATTIVTLACDGGDAACFCSAVGLDPGATRGSDLRLVPVAGGYRVDVVSAKGEELVVAHRERFGELADSTAGDDWLAAARERQRGRWNGPVEAVRAWLGEQFEHELWGEMALRCHGCGACAALCPTCHCFDIVDEPEGVTHGVRRRNWDTCQTARFTVHASGHNPRADQTARLRQRVRHKFHIYPERFGEVLCTGCGRCSRACPGGVDLPEILSSVVALAAGSGGAVETAAGGAA